MNGYTLVTKYQGVEYIRNLHDNYLQEYNPKYGLMFRSPSEHSSPIWYIVVLIESEDLLDITHLALILDNVHFIPVEQDKITSTITFYQIREFIPYVR